MSSGGLGQTDIGSCSDCVGGLAREFYERNRRMYPAVPSESAAPWQSGAADDAEYDAEVAAEVAAAVASCRLPAANCTATYNLEPDKALHIFQAMLSDASCAS